MTSRVKLLCEIEQIINEKKEDMTAVIDMVDTLIDDLEDYAQKRSVDRKEIMKHANTHFKKRMK